MARDYVSRMGLDRRRWLKLSVTSVVAARCQVRCCVRNLHRKPALLPSRKTANRRTAACARTRFHGSTKTATTTRPQCPMSNSPASITSREGWHVAAVFTEWARTTKAIASPGALPQPTTVTWRVSTGRHASHTRAFSPTPDSPYSRDRRSLRTRSMIFILPSRQKASTGLCRCHLAD